MAPPIELSKRTDGSLDPAPGAPEQVGDGDRCAACHDIRILAATDELGDSGFCERCLARARVPAPERELGGSG